jgi:hypothetical protein
VIGRIEGRHQTDVQLRGIAGVRAAVTDVTAAVRYRSATGYSCLDYRRGTLSVALELCFDDRGRVLEASDRRRSDIAAYSLRLDPAAATTVLGAERLVVLRRLKANAAEQLLGIAATVERRCYARALVLARHPGTSGAGVAELFSDAQRTLPALLEVAAGGDLERLNPVLRRFSGTIAREERAFRAFEDARSGGDPHAAGAAFEARLAVLHAQAMALYAKARKTDAVG